MSYYEKVIRPGENIELIGSLHWLVHGGSLSLAISAITAFMIGVGFSFYGSSSSSVWILIAAILSLIAVVKFFLELIRIKTTEIVVTDRRVIYKTGLFGRSTVEMNISKIETVDVHQSISGRIFGFGTVLIRGTGAGFEPLRRIRDPLALRSAILVG